MRFDGGRMRAEGHEHVVFDGIDLNDHFEITGIQAPVFPAIEAITTKVPGRAGEHYYSASVGVRVVTMTLYARADSDDPFSVIRRWRELSPTLLRDEPRPLYLDDDWYLMAMLTGETPIEFTGERGRVEVEFTAFDPRYFGPVHEIPLKAGANTFLVQSNIEVWPTIRVTGASSPLDVKNALTEDMVRIPAVGAYLPVEIRMEEMKTYSGSNYVPVDIQYTDFFSLPPFQEATIELSSGSGTLTYQELSL